MSPGEVLREAAALLERDGWCQGEFDDEDGQHCLVGAINDVLPEGTEVDVYVAALEPVQLRIGHSHIPTWNDARGRSQAEVVKLLLQAADDADAAEVGS